MGKERVGVIRINKRTVHIGHEVYPLANISRVRSGRLITDRKGAQLGRLVLLIILVGALVTLLTVRPGMTIVTAVGGFLALWAFLVLIVFLCHAAKRRRYALLLETAGTQFTALSGTDLDEINRIKNEIVGAIEEPPDQERILHVSGDLVLGDKNKQQGGTGNQMTISQ